ncbi:MAG TPA: aspartate racemase [Rhodobacteraceae bacterium]|nr:aspartate racemase [Paracoccaceae bacterium]
MPRTVGILGGMGPEATILLQQKLIAAVPARDDADHVPLLIDMNPQVPSRIAHLIEGDGEDPGPTLGAMAKRLEGAGAKAIAMPCNTAHHYAEAIRGAIGVPFLDMVALASDHAAARLGPGGRVGLLASPAVRMTGLYEAALGVRGLDTLWPDDDAPMLAAIREIKAGGGEDAAKAVVAAADELTARGAGLLFVACTEFSLIADRLAPAVPVIDTLDILTDEIVAFAQDANPTEQSG